MLSPYNITRRYREGNTVKLITVTELRLRTTEIVREIEETGEEVIFTKKGKPVVLMGFILSQKSWK